MMRRIIVAILITVSVFLLCGAEHHDAWYAEETGEALIINGELFAGNNPVLTVRASHYFPLREMFRLFGVSDEKIVWNGIDTSVTISSERFGEISLIVNRREYLHNGITHQMKTDIIQYGSVVYLPSDFYADVFGLQIGYDQRNRAVLVRNRAEYDEIWSFFEDMFYCKPDSEEKVGYHYRLETELLEAEYGVWVRREHRTGTAFFVPNGGYCEDNGTLLKNQHESAYRYIRYNDRGFFYSNHGVESARSVAEGIAFRGALLKKIGYSVVQDELVAVDLHAYGMFDSMSDFARRSYFMEAEKTDGGVKLFGSMTALFPEYEEYELFFELDREHRVLSESKKTLSKVYSDQNTPPVRQRELAEYFYFSE